MSGDSQKLLELAERCEKVAGPDRNIDRAIEDKFFPAVIGLHPTPTYTASLDAALTLVAPEDSWTLSRFGDGLFWCSISFPDDEADNFTGTGETPVAALIAAALRARAAI